MFQDITCLKFQLKAPEYWAQLRAKFDLNWRHSEHKQQNTHNINRFKLPFHIYTS